jgi:hypothetical protein
VNLTSFFARWLAVGLDDSFDDRSENSIFDISIALDEDRSCGLQRDCVLLVAAHYILLAGPTLANDCLKKVPNKVGSSKWKRWAEKFEEISKQEPNNTRLALATKAAGQYMFSLHREILG